jgi:hypothetical protein
MFRQLLYPVLLSGLLIFIIPGKLASQVPVFNRQDTLRGSITHQRAWWDLIYYHLDIRVNPSDSTITGTNSITYRVISKSALMQIDLQEPLVLISAKQNGSDLSFRREGNVYWLELVDEQERGKVYSVVLSYCGKPKYHFDHPGAEE